MLARISCCNRILSVHVVWCRNPNGLNIRIGTEILRCSVGLSSISTLEFDQGLGAQIGPGVDLNFRNALE